MSTTFQDHVNFADTVTFAGVATFLSAPILPAGSVTNASVATSAEIDTSKQKHRFVESYDQIPGADVVAATKLLHIARAAGEVHSVKVRVITAPNTGDKQFTVDVQKAAAGSGAWATILSAVVTFADADTDNTVKTATLTGATLIADDAVRIIVAVSGTTGTQGQGLLVTVEINESGI